MDKRILGVRFDDVTPAQALELCRQRVRSHKGGYVVTPNAEIVYSARTNPELMSLIEHSAITVPDGIGIILAAKLLKKPLRSRVPGVELGEQLVAASVKDKASVYFLGAKPGVAEIAAQKLSEKYPGLQVAGFRDGYFSDFDAVCLEVQQANPDILFVCMGSPRQERFMAQCKRYLPKTLMLGLGGSLDIYAGTLKRAPKFFCKFGLEWLYRLCQEPKRIGRILTLPKFLFWALKVRFTGRM